MLFLVQFHADQLTGRCPSGWGPVQQINGNKMDVRITHGCGKDEKRTYCCPSDDMPTCEWRGSAPSCQGACHGDEIDLTYDTGGCSTGHKNLCCKRTTSDKARGECGEFFCLPVFIAHSYPSFGP